VRTPSTRACTTRALAWPAHFLLTGCKLVGASSSAATRRGTLAAFTAACSAWQQAVPQAEGHLRMQHRHAAPHLAASTSQPSAWSAADASGLRSPSAARNTPGRSGARGPGAPPRPRQRRRAPRPHGRTAAAWSSLSGPVNKPCQPHSPLAPLAQVSVCATRRPGREERDGMVTSSVPSRTAPADRTRCTGRHAQLHKMPSVAPFRRCRRQAPRPGPGRSQERPRRRRTRPARALRTARAPLHRCLTRGRPGSPSRHDLLACLHEHCRTWHSVFSIGQILT